MNLAPLALLGEKGSIGKKRGGFYCQVWYFVLIKLVVQLFKQEMEIFVVKIIVEMDVRK